MTLSQINAYRSQLRTRDWASQSVIIRSDTRPCAAWSVQLMRKRSLLGGLERRGYVLFAHAGRIRFEIGSR